MGGAGKMKNLYFIWIEGLEPKTGEKVNSFRYSPERGHEIEYTTRMMSALRVTEDQLPIVRDLLKDCHVADWVLKGRVFISTSYCPKNTLWDGEISE